MKPQFAALGLAVAAVACPAAEPAAKDAVALVEQGAAFLRAQGKAELIKRINARDPMFYHGDLYLHMRDARTGVMLAHPVRPSLVGQELTDVPDALGRKYRRDIIELAAARGKGWVDYTYRNPADGHAQPRSNYIARIGDVVLESGID
ncbi:MAG TPA: cache domain-containing protein, partial [Noviherbaspirillum sp.]